MNTHSTVAQEFRLSLEAGVINRSEIIRWAEGIMATEEYDDRIADICLATEKTTNKDLESLLAAMASHEDEWSGVRRMLGRMHDTLLRDPERHEFTRFLERIWGKNDYEVPKDLNFIIGIEDDFLLAESGQVFSLEEFRKELIEDLAHIKHD